MRCKRRDEVCRLGPAGRAPSALETAPPSQRPTRSSASDLADKLAAAAQAAAELRAAEADVDRAREDFREALRAARAAGVPFAVLGRLVGLSRQRVARIVGDG